MDTFFRSYVGKYDTKYDKNCLSIPKAKMTAVKKHMKENILEIQKEKFYHKVLNRKDYLTTDKLEIMNRKEIATLEKLRRRTEELYTIYLQDQSKYRDFYERMDEVISLIDYIKSGVKCAKINNYVKPILDEKTKEAYFDIKGIRHPIIENVNKEVPFISNDIRLDSNNKGMIISGINGIGKSSLLKNVGINLVIAQSGYYVPCQSMIYTPFTTILTRIKGNDNIYTNSSSYTVEIQELSNILKKADNRSLILIDELSKGTEVASAHSLTIAIIKNLIYEKKSRFILTSHLHSIFNNIIINKLWEDKEILVKHLSMDINEDNIIYTRKLTNGPSKTEYGLEIARTLGIDSIIINEAIKIRDEYLNKSEIMTTKQSLYNSSVYMNMCEICGSNKQLETHHIREQNEANEDGYILDGNFHKNDKHNLSILCKECHKKITFGKIKMTQRIMTNKGPRVKILVLKKENHNNTYIGEILSDYRKKRISWKSMPKLLKNKHNIEISQYQCQKIFKEYIK
jgi:DNA mismatch repair protein MutS